MYILDLTYMKSLEFVDKFLEEHRVYLNKYYERKNFICSGRKNPRTGGVILAIANSLDEINEIIAEDPFYINEVAEYHVTEFIPTRSIVDLQKYLT